MINKLPLPVSEGKMKNNYEKVNYHFISLIKLKQKTANATIIF